MLRFFILLMFVGFSCLANELETPTISEIAEHEGIPYPIPKTQKTREEIETIVRRKMRAYMDEQVAEFDEEKVRKDAEEKYQLWKIGDEIDVVDKLGRVRKGKIKKLSLRQIKVGYRYISKVDFTKQILLHLKSSTRQKAIEEYIENAHHEHIQNKKKLKVEKETQYLNELYKNYSYINIRHHWFTDKEAQRYLESLQQTIELQLVVDAAKKIYDIDDKISRIKKGIKDYSLALNIDSVRGYLEDLETTRYENRQRALGRVKYEGEWMTPSERNQRIRRYKEAKAEREITDKQRALNMDFSSWNGSHIGLVRYVKSQMHDPKSFKHVETAVYDMDDHFLVKMKFRGSNAFGGIVTNTITAEVDFKGNVIKVISQ